ncbi:hypothetical protein [Alteromonas lipolytica]|uniref:Uncharacterized protein n=1 Tax=Alteromonas lipolytica TaxID=1856405 RepID=A0A1E8FCR1_9ALTE|nr:hypothetical protein [Alteromonas lipolytica]OFI33710.1 hypothetical protein BFC17_19220 [Alteromonas lipolytica]GGF69140.1 hypothetical protein GCM10011338_21610 [Alteromonas lipolytica]
MKFPLKLLSLSIISTLSLSGCLEVDDDGNKEVAESLRQQNQILTEQNQLLSQQEEEQHSVTISGVIIDTNQDEAVADGSAIITVLQGETVLTDGIETSDGLFTIEDLPTQSDLTVYVTFADGSFVNRAFFITTPSAEGEAYFDLGTMAVSKPVEVTFSVLNNDTGDAISGLEFVAHSYYGNRFSTAANYAHVSSFDDTTQTYSITLPRDFGLSLRAIADLDNDGEPDFDIADGTGNAYFNNEVLYVSSPQELEGTALRLVQLADLVPEEKTIRITLVNEDGELIPDAAFTIFENNQQPAYDDSSEQYSVDTPFDGHLSLTMPGFTSGETYYRTGSVSINRSTDSITGQTWLRVSTNGFSSNSYYEVADNAELSLVLVAQSIDPTVDIDIETVASFLSQDDFSYTVYYSSPVQVDEANVSLTYESVEIIVGNESDTDAVPAGYTRVRTTEAEVALSLTTGLNNTQLILTPDSALPANTEHQYTIGMLTDVSSGQQFELYEDEISFTTPVSATAVFDINDIIADNENYYTNGSLIVSENSAGVSSEQYEYRDSVYFYLPTSIETLNYLILNLVSYTDDGYEYQENRTIEVVMDGDVNYSRYVGLNIASNEILDANYTNYRFIRGATLDTGDLVYRVSSSFYLGDNKPESVNTVRFNYEYQTNEGVTASGVMELPVR